ncbi:MAG: BatA domain-containing protein [bacterium]
MTFLHPLYLIGLALTAVPIIIHLWFRKKLDKIPFSTLKFLRRSEARRFGWLKIREIIILVLRCMLIVFIFLSLARLQIKAGFLKPGHLASVILIIDNSYSMAYGDNFCLAQESVETLLTRYSSKSEFAVFALCRSDSTSYPDQILWMRKGKVIDRVRQIAMTNMTGTIQALSRNFTVDQARYPVEFIYIGDGQEIVFADFPRELFINQTFHWVKIPSGENVGIKKVFLKDPVAIISDSYVLDIYIENYGSYVWQGKVTLQAKDYMREQDCEIRPAHEIKMNFTLPINMNKGTVKLHDDSLSVDNIYYFSKSLPKRMNILVVGTIQYLESGLNPADQIDGPFLLTTAETISGKDLQHFDLVILNGLQEISNSDRINLETFLMKRDKGIVCFLGKAVGDNLNNFIGRCCHAEEYIAAKGYVTLDWIDYEHPIFQVFHHTNVLKNIKIHNYYKLSTDKNIIAMLTGNNPFIVIDNNFAVVATQFLPQNTDIVYKSAFVPLLHRLIVSTAQQSLDYELCVGDQTHQYGELKTPTGEYIISGQELLVPGFYASAQDTIGVNVAANEGNLKIIGNEAAKALHVKIVDAEKDFELGDMSATFLLLALFALLFELLMLAIR